MVDLNKSAEQVAIIFNNLFSRRATNASARKEEFIKRKPKKLDGFNFLVAMTLGRFKKSAS